MKLLLCLLIVAASAAADEAADRSAIQRVVVALKDTGPEIESLPVADRREVQIGGGIWPEAAPPSFAVQGVRFIAPDVALVDVWRVQVGSLPALLEVPILLVMKKESNQWRIAGARALATRVRRQ